MRPGHERRGRIFVPTMARERSKLRSRATPAIAFPLAAKLPRMSSRQAMFRISFRQSMLAGFLLIAVLLGWAAIQSWLTLEYFVAQSQRDSAQALELNAAIQELAERTVDLERSGRQFLVLNDPVLLKRFDEHSALALTAVPPKPGPPDRVDRSASP